MPVGVVQCCAVCNMPHCGKPRNDLCPACAAHNMLTSPLAYWSISVEHQDADMPGNVMCCDCCCYSICCCCCAVVNNCRHVGCGMTLAIFGSCKAHARIHAHRNYHSTSSSNSTTTKKEHQNNNNKNNCNDTKLAGAMIMMSNTLMTHLQWMKCCSLLAAVAQTHARIQLCTCLDCMHKNAFLIAMPFIWSFPAANRQRWSLQTLYYASPCHCCNYVLAVYKSSHSQQFAIILL